MDRLQFQWDTQKDRANQKKHGVSFKEASSVFYDEYAIQFYDPDHSEDEDRFLMLGMSVKLRVLVVCHCFREGDSVVRLISARKVGRLEEKSYWRQRKK